MSRSFLLGRRVYTAAAGERRAGTFASDGCPWRIQQKRLNEQIVAADIVGEKVAAKGCSPHSGQQLKASSAKLAS
jgi:hypothetical protein